MVAEAACAGGEDVRICYQGAAFPGCHVFDRVEAEDGDVGISPYGPTVSGRTHAVSGILDQHDAVSLGLDF